MQRHIEFLLPPVKYLGGEDIATRPSTYQGTNWARLIQKIYEVDPLTCPKCKGRMRILAFIADEEVIKKILKHLGLWDQKARPPPKVTATTPDIHIDYSDSQVPACDDYLFHDPEYPIEAYTS
ncbi:MAG: hypothetical protein SV375_16685 [Thermodesulfobacteriota bacterium]|nr:hypothetical protein [Thermodesulfobacteriota bacterium]